jgi:hypothetical protein
MDDIIDSEASSEVYNDSNVTRTTNDAPSVFQFFFISKKETKIFLHKGSILNS